MKIIMSLVLLVALFVLASPTNAQISAQEVETVENALVQAMQIGRTTALKDAGGKITKMDVDFFSRRQQLQFDYENSMLSAITLDNGVKATILRNKNGKLKGFSFLHGSQLIFIYKKVPGLDYEIPEGIKFIGPNGKEKVLRLADMVSQKRGVNFCQNVSFSKKTSAFLDPEADCQFAVAAATAAAANAAVACAYDTPTCITATGIALIAAANAVRICRRIGDDGGFGGGGDAGGGGSGGDWTSCRHWGDCALPQPEW